MNQTNIIIAGAVATLAAVVLFAAIGGFGMTTASVSNSSVREAQPLNPPADGSYGVAVSAHETAAGWNLFGWQVREPRYTANIAVVPPPGCEVGGNTNALVREGPCAGAAVEGDIGGNGTTVEGVDFVIVAVRISSDCYEALEDGDRWPSAHPSCS